MPPPMLCTGSAIPTSMKKHKNIPIFISHKGCPHQCVFCNQKTISGSTAPTLAEMEDIIETSLEKSTSKTEIAFFGGSFTGIDRGEMISYLSLAARYLQQKKICGIRLSTRPDYIDNEILDILTHYGVTDIELGVQSLSDKVLSACHRGHSAADTVHACRLIKSRPHFTLVGQMMPGLPASTKDDDLLTARMLFDLGVDAIRLYPTIVLKDTPLYESWQKGDYMPLSLESAVEICADILEEARLRGVSCLRLGLCENESLHMDNGMQAGPFHEAFGELVMGELMYRQMCAQLQGKDVSGKEIIFLVYPGSLSKVIGHKKCNYNRLLARFLPKKIHFIESSDMDPDRVRLQEDHTIAP